MNNTDRIDLIGSDGFHLFSRLWGNPKTAKATVVLVHGLGEHIGRYEHVAKAFNDAGIAFFGYDQRGHGQTEGKRGWIPSGQQMVNDIASALQLAKALSGGKPVFLYGHSMGAGEVLYYGLVGPEKPDGVLASSAPLYTAPSTAKQKKLAKIMARIAPGLTIKNGLELDGLSHDKAVVEAYKADPLVHPMACVRLGNYMFDSADYTLAHAAEWNLPLYLAHGTADPICDIRGTEAFASKITGDITFKRWEGLYHETHNEPEKDIVIAEMVKWALNHLG